MISVIGEIVFWVCMGSALVFSAVVVVNEASDRREDLEFSRRLEELHRRERGQP